MKRLLTILLCVFIFLCGCKEKEPAIYEGFDYTADAVARTERTDITEYIYNVQEFDGQDRIIKNSMYNLSKDNINPVSWSVYRYDDNGTKYERVHNTESKQIVLHVILADGTSPTTYLYDSEYNQTGYIAREYNDIPAMTLRVQYDEKGNEVLRQENAYRENSCPEKSATYENGILREELFYSESGKMDKAVTYNDDGSIHETQIVYYDEDDEFLGYAVFDSEGNFLSGNRELAKS